jgi:hypothetical protein
MKYIIINRVYVTTLSVAQITQRIMKICFSNDDIERIWKVVTQYEVLTPHFLGRNEETQEKPQLG